MNGWVRLWHDMPTDPKWRVIARKSGQRIGDVIAIFNFVMVNASANASERGRTHNLFAEDIGAAIDMDEADVQRVLDAMNGKVVDAEGNLLGWEKRQPKREDNSAERARQWRAERKRTQTNAPERPDADADTETEEGSKEPMVDFWKSPPVPVPAQVWRDFKKNRKAKRLSNTKTAYDKLGDDLHRLAVETGRTMEEILIAITAKGWGAAYYPYGASNGRTDRVAGNNGDGLSETARAALDVFGD